GREPGHRAEATDGAAAERTRLDRDEVAGEGPRAAVRDGQRLRRRRDALPVGRAGAGGAAERGLPAPEVRPPAPRAGERRGRDRARTYRRGRRGDLRRDRGGQPPRGRPGGGAGQERPRREGRGTTGRRPAPTAGRTRSRP